MEFSVETALQTLLQQYPDTVALKRCLYAAIENIMCDTPKKTVSQKKPVRIYIDGCFDIMHSGHYNALRQAKKLGDVLVVGRNKFATGVLIFIKAFTTTMKLLETRDLQ